MAPVPETLQEKRQGPRLGLHCGDRAIASVRSLNQMSAVGRIGLSTLAAGIWIGTAALLVDLCETCGTVLGFFVEEPRRQWLA